MHESVTSPHGRKQWRSLSVFFLLALSLLLVACGQGGTQDATNALGTPCPSTGALQGSGSTFDNPLFSKMFAAYAHVPCASSVSYFADGSGAGVNDLLEQNVDFAATDIPLTNAALARSKYGPILHIPITLGTEAIVYHVIGVPSQLKLTGSVLADIFPGHITAWNDPPITQLNPGVSLPPQSITVIHRSDGSGTTGSIGYVELSYALRLHLPYAMLQNVTGQYVAPSIQGAQAAASSVGTIPTDLRFYIVNAPGTDAYPLSGYSWVIVYQQQNDTAKGEALANLFWWMLHDGQSYAEPLHYAALSDMMVTRSEAQIRGMICGFSSCYKG